MEWFDTAIQLDPSNYMAYSGKGMALYHMERYHDAVEWFDRCLNISPDNSEADCYRAESLQSLDAGRA